MSRTITMGELLMGVCIWVACNIAAAHFQWFHITTESAVRDAWILLCFWFTALSVSSSRTAGEKA
jgi:hypothetical protein